MYDIFEKLCELNNVTPYRVCKETGLTTASISNWKAGRYTPKQDKMKKLADYFGVTVDYLTTGEESANQTNGELQTNGRDIALDISGIVGDIRSTKGIPVYYEGIELDEKSKELAANFFTTMMQQMELVLEMNKKK